MLQEKGRLKVLLIDGNDSITRFLVINLEHNGFEAPVIDSVEAAENIASGTKVDVVALASPGLARSRKDVSLLHKAFGCPVLAYGPGAVSGEGGGGPGSRSDSCVERFHEPADFLKAVEDIVAGKSRTCASVMPANNSS